MYMYRMLTYTLKYRKFTGLTDFFHSVTILINITKVAKKSERKRKRKKNVESYTGLFLTVVIHRIVTGQLPLPRE